MVLLYKHDNRLKKQTGISFNVGRFLNGPKSHKNKKHFEETGAIIPKMILAFLFHSKAIMDSFHSLNLTMS